MSFGPIVRLNQMRTEKERSKAEMKDLQQQLSEMHDELDRAKKAEMINADKEILLKVKKKNLTNKNSTAAPQTFT